MKTTQFNTINTRLLQSDYYNSMKSLFHVKNRTLASSPTLNSSKYNKGYTNENNESDESDDEHENSNNDYNKTK